MTLELNMKVCDLWKYYFNLTKSSFFLNLDKSKIVRYWLPINNSSFHTNLNLDHPF
jgi:hypothetical protein